MSLVIVGTGSQQKVRKKRTETDRAVRLAVLWNRGQLWRAKVDMHVGPRF